MSRGGPVLPGGKVATPASATVPSSVRDVATVDVWHVHLNMAPERLSELSQCLSQEEHARAARFHFDRHRARFVAARGSLRHLLGRYLDERPELVRFDYGPQGKPVLLEYPDLHFNISHAADVLVVGVANNRQLGVDVEPVPSPEVVDSVTRIVFSAPERRRLHDIVGAERCEFFAQLWTRKEAYIKADGQGMSLPLDQLDVSTVPDRVLLLDETCDQWLTCPRWSLGSLPVGYGFAGAVAAEGDWHLVYHDLELDRRDTPSRPGTRPGAPSRAAH